VRIHFLWRAIGQLVDQGSWQKTLLSLDEFGKLKPKKLFSLFQINETKFYVQL
jgi:hypothetical protein